MQVYFDAIQDSHLTLAASKNPVTSISKLPTFWKKKTSLQCDTRVKLLQGLKKIIW